MTLESLLAQRKTAVLQGWRALIVKTYPADASEFLKRQENRFQNPVGYAISRETEGIYDALIGGLASNVLSSAVDSIIKIRAVQDFSPSQAVSFVFLLKRVIREQLADEIRQNNTWQQLVAFESRIDELALCAFDSYVRCREKIHDIRISEIKSRAFGLQGRGSPGAAESRSRHCRSITKGNWSSPVAKEECR